MSISKTCICVRSALVANGLVNYIHAVSPASSVNILKSASDLLRKENLNSSIIFLDLQLLTGDYQIILEKIKQLNSSCILTGLADHQINERYLPYFDHFILTDDNEEKIVATLHLIYQPAANQYTHVDNIQVISERESEILKYVAQGFTNKEISDKLNISVHTVITHRKNITFKLGIKTIAGLTVYAILKGIITTEEV
jgi:DNA-binding NarL/FixJ family response regulator